MIGETVSHYEITGTVGSGGMGDVYRARDPRLDREVAIKFLPVEFSRDSDRMARFEREARATSSLNHPNIMAIYDVGRHDGQPYMVCELLEGSTLRERIRSGDLTPRKAIEWAEQIGEGLAAAHDRGIVHRDLKPANIFVTRDGHVKILDFGLAKLTQAPQSDPGATDEITPTVHTQTGTVVGTVGYMAPEQLRGKATDHRADIFSFGAVLFEMLAGQRPFPGESNAQVAAAILRDDPPPFEEVGSGVSPALERIVRQCLEKRPEERFQSTRDLVFSLRAVADSGDWTRTRIARADARRWPRKAAAAAALVTVAVAVAWALGVFRSPPVLPEAKRVAVLSLSAADGDEDGRLLAAGLTEVMADGLDLFETEDNVGFWVTPRAVARQWGGDTLEQMHRQFNVTLGLTGALSLSGDRIRLDLELVDAATLRSVKTRSLELSTANLSSFQNEPILAAAQMLELEITDGMRDALEERTTNVAAAFDAYVRGRGLLDNGDDLDGAITSLETAVDADRLFVPAASALARAYSERYRESGDGNDLDRAIRYAQGTVESGQASAMAYRTLARVYRSNGMYDQAFDASRRSVAAAPRSADAHIEHGKACVLTGRKDEAARAYRRAVNLRPDYWLAHINLESFYLDHLVDLDAAANSARQMIQTAPLNYLGYNALGGLLYRLGRREEAREILERSLEIEPSYAAYSNLGTDAYEESRFADAVDLLEKAIEIDESDYLVWGNLAAAYNAAGRRAQAELAFRRAIELAKQKLGPSTEDQWLIVDVAAYHAALGETDASRELLARATTTVPQDAELMARIGEVFEELDDREQAIVWIGRAFDNGLVPEWIERSPQMRDLQTDPRFRQLLEASAADDRVS